jgi:WD40 repeat protein
MRDTKMLKSKLLYQLTFQGSWPTAVTFLGSERKLVGGNQNGDLYYWKLPENVSDEGAKEPAEKKENAGKDTAKAADCTPAVKLVGHTNTISKLVYSQAQDSLLSASYDRSVRLWSCDQETKTTTEAILDKDSRQQEFKKTKKDEVLKKPGIQLRTLDSVATLSEHHDWIHTLALQADGRQAISGDASSEVIVWDLENRKLQRRWKGHPWNWIIAAAMTADGKQAAISEYRYKRDDFDIPSAALKIWNTETSSETLDLLQVQFPKLKPSDTSYGGSQLWRKFIAHGLVALTFSPDGTLLAAAQGGETDTGKIHLLDTTNGKLIRTISGHQNGATDVQFSADGKRIFSAGRDTCVRITRVEDGKELAILGAPRGGQFKDWISAIAIAPGENFIAAADIAGQINIWQLAQT